MLEILPRCRACKKQKLIFEFATDRKRKNGHSTICKSCDSERRKKLRLSNLDKERTYDEARRSTDEYKEKKSERNKRYIKSHREKKAQYNNKRRALKRGCTGTVTAEEWKVLIDRYENKCLCCGRKNLKLTIDHVVPLSKGGSNTIDNIQPLCISCNSKKRTKVIDYRKELVWTD